MLVFEGMRSLARLAAVCAALAFGGVVSAGALLIPKEPPEWKVADWINGNPGKLADQRGKVVLIEFFQMWCPVSNSFALPLFQRWEELYGDRDDVAIVAIHTVFEQHAAQSPDKLRAFVQELGIPYPVGIDMHESDDPVPTTMQRFGNEGTPQVAIVDKFGMLRWSHFGRFDYRPVESFIDRLLLEKTAFNADDDGGKSSGRSRKSSSSSSSRGRTPPPSRESSSRRAPPPSRDPRADDAEDAEEPEEGDDGYLSGKYRVTLQQTSKSCGELLPPQTVFTDLTVAEGQILVKFSRRYLEQQEVTLDFAGGAFQTTGQAQSVDRGTDVGLRLSVNGRFVEGAEPPELEFEFQLDETSQDGSMDCSITGTGNGSKAGG